MWHAWDRRGKRTRFWWEIPKERNHSEDRSVDGIGMVLREIDLGGCGVNSVGSGTGGGLL
jgi:hypothetical protein